MTGLARFSALDEGTLRYREEGDVRLFSGSSNPAFREFLYSLEDRAIVVRLVDGPTAGNVLFRLEPAFSGPEPWPAEAESSHRCRDDLYRGRYAFESPERFRTEVRIEGPKKTDRIVTTYTRPGPQ